MDFCSLSLQNSVVIVAVFAKGKVPSDKLAFIL